MIPFWCASGQVLGYLKSARLEHGLLINFGSDRFELRKFAWSQEAARRKSTPSFLFSALSAFSAVLSPKNSVVRPDVNIVMVFRFQPRTKMLESSPVHSAFTQGLQHRAFTSAQRMVPRTMLSDAAFQPENGS